MKKAIICVMTLVTILHTACNDSDKPKVGYTGQDISNEVSIIRDKTAKTASIQIYTEGQWTLYGGRSVEDIDFVQPIAQGINSGTFAIDVPDSVRTYFQIETNKGTAIVADKHLPMKGGYNFRDMGGYKTTDNRFVKWGKVFRADDLQNLTDADLKYLASIPLTSIVDFRSEEEIKAGEDKNPSSVKTNYALSINPGNLMQKVKGEVGKVTPEEADRLMEDLNELLVSNSKCVEQYKEFFALLQNDNETPLLFHCSAGKDRTGMGAALFLAALGVGEETIMKDYMLSNMYLANKYAKLKAENPNMKSFFEVKPQFLEAGFKRIKTDHGSIENFLTNVLGVDINKMREKYLY